MRAEQAIEARWLALSQMERTELRTQWVAAFKKPPPNHISLIFMRKALIWRAQTDAFGGLKTAHRRLLEKTAGGGAIVPPKARASSGAQLVREWNGRRYVVNVTASGFELDGTRFKSLSAVARHITGARWSGPRFFGVQS